MANNLTVKLVCVLVALLLWAQAAANYEVEKMVEMPLVLIGTPDSLVVRKADAPEKIWVRVRSTKLQLLVNDVLRRDRGKVEVNLGGAREGPYRRAVSVRDVVVDATALAVEPPVVVDVQVHRRLSQPVPVHVVTEGELPEGITLAGRPSVIPGEVQVSGPAPLVQALGHVNTEPIRIGRRRKTFSETVKLSLPDPDLSLMPVEVEVSLGIDEIVERPFVNLPISVFSQFDSTRIFIQPELAQVRVRGPARAVNALGPQDVSVVLHVGEQEPGVYQLEPEVVVPDGIVSSSVQPSSFQVIVEGDRPDPGTEADGDGAADEGAAGSGGGGR